MTVRAYAARRFASACAIGGLLSMLVVGPARAAPAASSPLPDAALASTAVNDFASQPAANTKAATDPIAEQLAGLENAGRAQPADAAARLGELLRLLPAGTPEQVQALTMRGMLQAARHGAGAFETSLHVMDGVAPGAPLATAAALVRAAKARDVGPLRHADHLAAEAQALMPAAAPTALRWQLLKLHARIKHDRAELDEALRLQHQALVLVDRLGTAWRRSEARSSLAYTLLLARQVEPGPRPTRKR